MKFTGHDFCQMAISGVVCGGVISRSVTTFHFTDLILMGQIANFQFSVVTAILCAHKNLKVALFAWTNHCEIQLSS